MIAPPVNKYDSTPAGTLLGRDTEIASKLAYAPGPLEQQYNGSIYAEFNYALWQFQNSHKFFNDRTLVEYMQRNQLDVVSYVPPRRDQYDWRNHRRSTTQYDKTAALVSFFVDLNFQCEPTAQDWLGRVNPDMADVAGALLQHASLLDNGEEKDKMADYAMLVDGTVSEEVSWVTRQQVKKEASSKWMPDENPEPVSYKTSWIDTFEGVESKLNKLNRILLGDVSKSDIKDQPYVFREYVIPYDIAYQMFHHYYKWKFVKPFDFNSDQWTDTDTDIEIEESQVNLQKLVRVRIYENLTRNEYALYLNRVLMTPVGMPLPYGRYSITWQQASPLNQHFSYGRSFVGQLRADVATRDVLYSLFIDRGRQGLEPPMKSSFKALINRHMFRPGAITPMQGGVLEPLIPQNAYQNFAKEAIEMLNNSIDRASVSPIFQGQDGGTKTKYEVEQQLINSIRTAALIVSATVNRRRQKAKLMMDLILKHYPELSFGKLKKDSDEVKRFVISSVNDNGSAKEIIFQEDQNFDLAMALYEGEEKAKKVGRNVKSYLVDPKSFRAHEYVLNYRVNPQQRSSKASDIAEAERKYMMYAQNPLIDQVENTKNLLKMNGDSIDEMMKEQQEQVMPQNTGQSIPMNGLSKQGGIAGTPPLDINQPQEVARGILGV